MILIGCDPAFRKNGFAICIIDEDRTVRCIQFKTFLEFLSWLWAEGSAPERAVVTIENSNLQNATFDMSGSKAEIARKSRNVGKNQAISQATVDAFKAKYGKDVFGISPKEKGGKWTNQEFHAVLKSERHTFLVVDPKEYRTGKVSQDKRDAYKLALMGKKLAMFRSAKIQL